MRHLMLNQYIEKVKPLLVDKEMISQTNNEPIETMTSFSLGLTFSCMTKDNNLKGSGEAWMTYRFL